ncbi:MAG: hypothetical protein Q9171_006059 [Xanthocarpia ochracea]
MLHHKGMDKAKHFLDLLDIARCNGNWSEVPELARKVGKHVPQRKCLQLTAQAESQIATTAPIRPSNTLSSPSNLSQLASGLLSASLEATEYPEDAFEARICLGWLHWTLNEPVLALQRLPVSIADSYAELSRDGKITSGWTTICAIKGAFVQGELQENAGKAHEALRTYNSMLPIISSTPLAIRSTPEYRNWTEQLLAQYGIMMEGSAKPDGRASHRRLYTQETLAPFRAWAEIPWANTSKLGNVGQSAGTIKHQSATRRRMWQLYYNSLSVILQQRLPYPPAGYGPSASAQEMSTDNVKSVTNFKLQQSIELRRVESIYEEILLTEVSFPKANEVNVEIESWTDQVIANWKVLSDPSWQNEDLGRGGKEAMTRNVLAILYRAATRTFHSTRILRHLFTIHTALAEFNLATKAFDTYIELVAKGKARVDKSGEDEVGLDDDTTVLEATAAGLEMLSSYGRRKQLERAQDIAAILEKWLEHIPSPSEPTASADDNPRDLKHARRRPGQPVPDETIAAAHRSLGICRAHWARLTYDVTSRPELQAKAIASFRTGLNRTLGPIEGGEIHYALAVILAETRDIDGALLSVKSTISLCTNETDEESSGDQDDVSYLAEDRRTRLLFKAWHLLAYLLSAKQDFATAIASCDAAYELYGDLIEHPGRTVLTERLSLVERERILELKMSQVALSELLDGPGEAVNAGSDLLGLYKRLFDYGQNLNSDPTATTAVLPTGTISPPQSANGTIKSARRSIFGRSKDAISHIPHSVHPSGNGLKTLGTRRGAAESPTISGGLDGQVDGQMGERRYQPPHHLARQESKKLRKRHSRKSMASDHRGRGASPDGSSYANGLDGAAQTLPSRVTEMKRPSMESSNGGSSVGGRHLSSERVGVAVSHNVPSTRDRGSSGPAESQRIVPISGQSTHLKNHNLEPTLPKPPPPPSHSPKPSFIASHPAYLLPDPIYPPSDLNRHALTLLARIWLLIAQLYRDAAMPVDAQGALSEAFKHAKSIEAAMAAIESSAQALSEPGWGKLKSAAEVWADVHAEQAALQLQLGNPDGASEEFEKALRWFPDHNAATVGLSNMLLDYYSHKRPAFEPAEFLLEPLKPKPMLASLPSRPSSQTVYGQRPDGLPEEPPALLSRLAARDRAYGLLSMLTKSGRGWDDSDAWFAFARVYEESGQEEKAQEALWWVVELEEGRPLTLIVDMADNKRKRHSDSATERPSKRVAAGQPPAEVVKVSLLPDEDEWAPVVASTPGLSFRPNLSLKPFNKPRIPKLSSTGQSHITNSEHLLHTSAHPKIDYIGREEEGGGTDGLLSHYIGVYDPQSGGLQLMRARKLVLRRSLRATPTQVEQEAEAANNISARSALGLTFGTKKSQRAIQNLTKNAISPSKKGGSTAGEAQPTLDPVAAAVVSSMAAAGPSVTTTREDLQAAIDKSKPRPHPNPNAQAPADVYPIDQLVGPGILRQLTVKDWQDAIEQRQEILTHSRFVSHRIQRIVSEGEVRKIKTLRYLLLLIEWQNILLPGPKGIGRRIPDRTQLREKLGKWNSDLVDGVEKRFGDGGRILNSWNLDNLVTHICALAITVDPEKFMTDVYDIREDLKLDNKKDCGTNRRGENKVASWKDGDGLSSSCEVEATVGVPQDEGGAGERQTISRYEERDVRDSKCHAAIDAGEYQPFVWPHRALGPYLLIFYLLLPPTSSPIVHYARYPLFALIIYVSVAAIHDCRSPAVTVGYGIGLLNAWTILWSATLMIFTDGRRDYKRIERQQRPDGAPSVEAFVENIQGETSALDGSTTAGLKLLHPVGELPEPEPSVTDDIAPKFESPEIFAAQEPIPSSSQEAYAWQSLPDSILHRLDFILDLVTNFRGIRWTHQRPGTHPPPPHVRETLTNPDTPPSLHPKQYPSYRTLFTTSLRSFLLCSLTLDALKYVTSLDPYFLAQGQNAPSPFPVAHSTRLALSLLFTYTSLLNIFLLAPLVLACTFGPRILGPHASTWLYPPFFGPLSSIPEKGLAGLWGEWWHQLFRDRFRAASREL